MRRRAKLREAVWALLLVSLLSAGVVGVLLFNTAMQRQAMHLAAQQQQIQQLQSRAQALQSSLQRAAAPAVLEQRARSLHMRPAAEFRVLRHRHQLNAVSQH